MPLFKEHLYRMGTYQPPLEGRSPADHLLLDFNERTLPVSEKIVAALCDYARSGRLQKYPAYGDIVEKLASYVGVGGDQLMITNGSDQGIELVTRASVDDGEVAIIPGPTFAMYQQVAEVENAQIISPRYKIETGYPTDEVIAAVTEDTRLIVMPLPNNPTGTAISRSDVERVLSAAPQAVILVDECYYEYSGMSVVELVDDYPNLVVARTFSKTWGMPSLRFGFLVSQAENINQLMKIRGPYDVNQLAVVAAEAALADPEYTEEYVREVMDVSKPMLETWLDDRDILYWRSEANYLWIFPERSKELSQFLRSRSILVRPKQDDDGVLGLRVTLGNQSQTTQLIESLREFHDNN